MKPLFIPLRTRWFGAYLDGTKTVEWRAYGPRWSRQVAARGRPVVLSHGYSGDRLSGTVVRSRKVRAEHAPQAAREIYPQTRFFCAIHLALSDGMPRNSAALDLFSSAGPM